MGGSVEVDLEGKTFGSYWEGEIRVHNFIPWVQKVITGTKVWVYYSCS